MRTELVEESIVGTLGVGAAAFGDDVHGTIDWALDGRGDDTHRGRQDEEGSSERYHVE